ncbi:MAG: hypothetical protein ACRDRL_13290 [Sciscionella sp.]
MNGSQPIMTPGRLISWGPGIFGVGGDEPKAAALGRIGDFVAATVSAPLPDTAVNPSTTRYQTSVDVRSP